MKLNVYMTIYKVRLKAEYIQERKRGGIYISIRHFNLSLTLSVSIPSLELGIVDGLITWVHFFVRVYLFFRVS